MMSLGLPLAKMYKWIGEKGNSHFFDNPRKTPLKYRTTDKKSQIATKEKMYFSFSIGNPNG
jgi:hypothetical protein